MVALSSESLQSGQPEEESQNTPRAPGQLQKQQQQTLPNSATDTVAQLSQGSNLASAGDGSSCSTSTQGCTMQLSACGALASLMQDVEHKLCVSQDSL